MSLNGLDDLKLKEAYDTAAAEPGGWFLLKYISRDEVELLGKGNGGIVEIRNAVSSYEEPSPLFGFLRYRRRNVLIKYVPEDCSRLVQARVAVHFNAVTERFSPHDTVFPITTAKELRDTTLSSACSLHTASGSTSSSTSSLRRRRLMEIAEDEEEDNRKRQSTVLEERPGTAKTSTTIATPASIPVDPSAISLPTTTSHKSIAASLETSPPPPREPTISERPSPATLGIEEPQPRKSSQSTRPDIYSYSSYGSAGRPKVKLGPRPSLDVTGSRPHTSGATSHYRPVSSLPVGLKIQSKGSRPRPQSQFNAEPPHMMISPPPMPDTLSQSYQGTPTRPHTSGGRPPPSPTFPIKPLMSPTSSATPKTPLITPEKARLMKALELRKKHMKTPVSGPTDTLSPSPNDNLNEELVETKRVSETPRQVQDTLAMLDDMAKASDSTASFDSNSAMKTDESDATRSDSYPVSPVGASEQAESTTASSISESTDETLQENNTPKATIEGEDSEINGPSPGNASESHDESAANGLQNGTETPSTGILVSPKLDVPKSPIEAVAVSNTQMGTSHSNTLAVQAEKYEETDDLDQKPVLKPEESSAVSSVEVTPTPGDLIQKAIPDQLERSAQDQVATPKSSIEEVSIPPAEPVKVDKHVTFDKSGDHIIEDTTIASEGSVATDDFVESEEPATIEALPSTDTTVVAENFILSEIPDSTLEETLTVDASVAGTGDASKFAESNVVKEGEDLVKSAEEVSPNKEQAIPEAVVERASTPVESPAAESPSITKTGTMTEKAKPDSPLEGILAQESSSKDVTKESEVQDSSSSSNDFKPAAAIPSISTEPPSGSENTAVLNTPQKSPEGSTFSIDRRRSVTDDEHEENGKPLAKRSKRKGLIEPIRTDLELTDRSGPNSDAHLSSDDDFMDELQSAVVQEAKPVSVSKSPINAMFPSPKKPDSWRNRFTRAASNPLKKGEANADLLTPPPKMEPIARSVSASAAYLNRINQENSKPLTKKVNVGSGISQRIKAFEKFSNGDPAATPPPSTGPLPGTTSAFFSVRKAPVRVASKSPSIADRANSLSRNQPSPSPSRESSPEARKARERSGSIKNRVSTFEPGVIPMIQPGRSKPESISVTARIVRDPDHPFQPQNEIGKDPSEYTPLDLKQSPLVIDHQKAINNTTPPKETIQERRLSKERRLSNSSDATNTTAKNRRSSITVVKDLINERRASFADRRRSINLEASGSSSNIRTSSRPPSVKSPSRPPSVRSPSRPPPTHSSPTHTRSQSISSRLSSSSNRDMPSASPTDYLSSSEDKAEKKSNRASRMLRRMSSSLSSGRKALAHAVSPTVREESEPVLGNQPPLFAPPHSPAPSTPSVNIGDVNVQFPDSLLWKRRSMLLDAQGFLILSPALTASGNGKSKAAGGAIRRFHLSEFRQPVIPDMEMEELPNSVLLDFFEGGGLQIACEDRAGQGRVLEVLQDAHRSSSGNGQ